jgi:hypothetical protein
MQRKNIIAFRLFTAVLIIIVLAASLPAIAQERKETKNGGAAIDALGELLRGLNNLSGGKKVLPEGDPFLEKVRTRYEVPERVQIIAPHSGAAIIAFVYDNERLPVMDEVWGEIYPNQYKYLQTYHNLKVVYCLHEKEPMDLGEIIVAIKPEYGGRFSVYFNDKRGAIDAAFINSGNAIIFSGSRYIVKPVLF